MVVTKQTLRKKPGPSIEVDPAGKIPRVELHRLVSRLFCGINYCRYFLTECVENLEHHARCFEKLPDASAPTIAPYPVLMYGLELIGHVPVAHPT